MGETMTETPQNKPSLEPLVSSSQADPKQEAKSLLISGLQPQEVASRTGLSLNQVYGLQERLKRQQKSHQAPTEETKQNQASLPTRTIEAPSQDNNDEVPPIPSGSVLLQPSDVEAIRNMIPKSHQSTYIAHIDLASKRQSQINRNDGHGSQPYYDGYGSENPELAKQKARIFKIYGDWMEQQTIDNMAEKMRNPKGATKDVTELVFKAFSEGIGTALKLASSKEGMGLSDYVNLTNAIRTQATKEIVATAGGNKSEIDLKLEEMRESHDIDMKKIEMDWQKYLDSKESQKELMGTVKDVVKIVGEGPIGKIISDLGEGAKNRIEGGPRVPMVKVQCPSCGAGFSANQRLEQVMCPACGANLQRQPTPEVSSAPTTTQPEQPETPPQPQSTEPKPETIPTSIEKKEEYPF